MDVGRVLLDILIVLVAAKLAAEGSERVGVPPVVGEILAGILIGPSVLGLVGDGDEVLRTLGELGVILLLLEVGMEMDLRELGAVGKASLATATVGVVAPLVLGFGADGAARRRPQDVAVRGRGADRHQRRDHRPRVRRPQGAGHHRGPHRVGRGGGRRRHGPRRADRGRAPGDRRLALRPRRGLDRGRGRGLPRPRRRRRPAPGADDLRLRRALLPLHRHAGGAGPRLHPGLRRTGRRRQAGADRGGLRRRPGPRPEPSSPSASAPSCGRSATCSSRSSSCRSASTPTSGPSSVPACCATPAILLAVAIVGKLVSPVGAIGTPRRQGTHRPGHAPPGRGRADLRHDRAGQRRPRRRPLRRAPAGGAGRRR